MSNLLWSQIQGHCATAWGHTQWSFLNIILHLQHSVFHGLDITDQLNQRLHTNTHTHAYPQTYRGGREIITVWNTKKNTKDLSPCGCVPAPPPSPEVCCPAWTPLVEMVMSGWSFPWSLPHPLPPLHQSPPTQHTNKYASTRLGNRLRLEFQLVHT